MSKIHNDKGFIHNAKGQFNIKAPVCICYYVNWLEKNNSSNLINQILVWYVVQYLTVVNSLKTKNIRKCPHIHF